MTETYDIEEVVRDMNKRIAEAPIEQPASGQRIDFCPYSRTGWAIYTSDGMCTCKPASPQAHKAGE